MTISSLEKKRVVAVDDNPDNLYLIQYVLEEEGYCVKLANSGQKAISLIEEVKPAVILLDLMMPKMNGYEVIACLHQQHSLTSIPIVLVTADRNPTIRRRAIEAGAVDLLYKPFELDELIDKVESLLK